LRQFFFFVKILKKYQKNIKKYKKLRDFIDFFDNLTKILFCYLQNQLNVLL